MRSLSLFVLASLFFGQIIFLPLSVKAASGTLSVLSDTMSRLKKSTNSSHVIKFKTSVAVSAAADTIVVTFPSDFNLTNSVIGDITFTHGASTGAETAETLASSPTGSVWGAAFSGTQSRILTLTTPTDGEGNAALAANNYVIITYAGTHVVNATVAGTYALTLAITGANTATGSISVVILDDEQIAVTGNIDNTLSFSISDNAIGFGSFANTNVRYATADALGSATEPLVDLPTKLTAGTNASRGLTITIQDEGSGTVAGLYSAVASDLIPAATSTDVINNSKKYGVYGKNSSGLTIHESFDNDTTDDTAITRTAQTFVSANAPVNSGTVDVALLAAIDATTKAGAYADTLTLICTGNY